MKDKYDLIIIGAGPIGLSCGIEAKKRNLNYLIIEKGCLVNSIFHYPTNMVFFSTSERLEIGEVPFISHGPKPNRTEALEYFRRVKTHWDLKVKLYEKVLAIEGEKNNFRIKTDKNSYAAKSVIVSTGFFDYPNLMNIPGEDLPKVKHYYDEPYPYVDQKIVVIGGGNSAVDVALETYRRGSDVTMVIKKDRLEENVKYWVQPDIENRINEGSIKAYFNSVVTEIKQNEVIIQTPDGETTVKNDFVLAMTGYRPDFEMLKNAGINLISGKGLEPDFDDRTFETNKAGLYLAGVVCGGMNTGRWFIENSRDHAAKIFNHIEKTNI